VKHTPAPWIVSHDPDAYSDDDYCIGVPDGKVDQIAVCSKRDAALIAAAPDLLAALRECLDLIDAITPIEGDTVRKARAALAKVDAP
jgi:hypothetical protein